MTFPIKRDTSNEKDRDPGCGDPDGDLTSSKRPRKEESKNRWMTYSGRRQPRVGNDFQVASLPLVGEGETMETTETMDQKETLTAAVPETTEAAAAAAVSAISTSETEKRQDE